MRLVGCDEVDLGIKYSITVLPAVSLSGALGGDDQRLEECSDGCVCGMPAGGKATELRR